MSKTFLKTEFSNAHVIIYTIYENFVGFGAWLKKRKVTTLVSVFWLYHNSALSLVKHEDVEKILILWQCTRITVNQDLLKYTDTYSIS